MNTSFDKFGLSKQLNFAIDDLGFKQPTPIQSKTFNIILSGKDIRHALDSLLHKKENTENQKPSIGCNIKWKS